MQYQAFLMALPSSVLGGTGETENRPFFSSWSRLMLNEDCFISPTNLLLFPDVIVFWASSMVTFLDFDNRST